MGRSEFRNLIAYRAARSLAGLLDPAEFEDGLGELARTLARLIAKRAPPEA
jgi:hypothetical protein